MTPPPIPVPPPVTEAQAAALLAALRDWAVPIILRVATQPHSVVQSPPSPR